MVKNLKKEFNIKTEKGTYKTLIWKDKNSGDYLVKAVNLPEVVTFGKSFAEAKKMAKDALEIYCDCLIDEGNIIVDDERRVVGKLPKLRVLAVSK